jgi:hypothetical protein
MRRPSMQRAGVSGKGRLANDALASQTGLQQIPEWQSGLDKSQRHGLDISASIWVFEVPLREYSRSLQASAQTVWAQRSSQVCWRTKRKNRVLCRVRLDIATRLVRSRFYIHLLRRLGLRARRRLCSALTSTSSSQSSSTCKSAGLRRCSMLPDVDVALAVPSAGVAWCSLTKK